MRNLKMTFLKKILTFSIITLISFPLSIIKAENTDNFVIAEESIKTKSLSKNELKEDIANNMKATIDECAFISATVGEILEKIAKEVKNSINADKNCNTKELLCKICKINEQVGDPLKEVGILQQKYSANIEKIIENKRPFKNASNNSLKGALIDSSNLLSNLKNSSKKLDQLKTKLYEPQNYTEKNILQLTEEVSINFKTQLGNVSKARVQFCKNECLK